LVLEEYAFAAELQSWHSEIIRDSKALHCRYKGHRRMDSE